MPTFSEPANKSRFQGKWEHQNFPNLERFQKKCTIYRNTNRENKTYPDHLSVQQQKQKQKMEKMCESKQAKSEATETRLRRRGTKMGQMRLWHKAQT